MAAPRSSLPILTAGAKAIGLDLGDDQVGAFARLAALLADWNRRVNLTSLTELDQIESRHFVDSLSCLLAFPPTLRAGASSARVLDVGAGAGFPGLPLKIVLPRLKLTALEATKKKCAFVEAAAGELGLADVRVVWGRAEDLGHDPALREQFDVVIARAVAALPTLVELCLPFARLGGRVIAPKKRGIDAEVRAAARAVTLLGGELQPSIPVDLPGLAPDRQLIVADKIRRTPRVYPRRAGLPARDPLT